MIMVHCMCTKPDSGPPEIGTQIIIIHVMRSRKTAHIEPNISSE